MVWEDRIVTTGKNGDVTPFHYKEHVKHKSCLTRIERLKHDKEKKRKKKDDDTSNLVYSS
jgi:hypothetical protein